MRRLLAPVLLAVLVMGGSATSASAQWFYPGGWGGYGFSQWGADPGAGYMAASGAYAKGQGSYLVQAAQARAIERDSLIKWNRAMTAVHRQQAAEKARRDAAESARDQALAAQARIHNGSALNELLDQILEFNPDGTRAALADLPLGAEAIRDIPFRSGSSAIQFCLDQLTAQDATPPALAGPQLADQRQDLADAVDAALADDTGRVKPEALQSIKQAVAALRARFQEVVPPTTPGFDDADIFLRTLTGLTPMLQKPEYERVLAQLEKFDGPVTVGELIRFMHAFNLRFAPATSPRQRQIYDELAAALGRVLTDVGGKPGQPAATAATILPEAAREVFQALSWDDLKAAGAASR